MPDKSFYKFVYELASSVIVAFCALLCIFPSEGFFFKWWEDHTFIIMLSCLLLGMVFLCLNYQRAMLSSLAACAALCLLLQSRTEVPLGRPQRTGETIIRITQTTYPKIEEHLNKNLDKIISTKSDLISVQLIALPYLAALHDHFICCGYPYYEYLIDSVEQNALAVYSRYPFIFSTDTAVEGAAGILGKVAVPLGKSTQELYLFSLFLKPSISEKDFSKTRQQLQIFGYQLNHIKAPLIACGDYNLVSWSKDVQIFKAFAHLNDSRRNVMTTSQRGHVSFWDYPFDHIFYSNHFKCINFETINSVSFEHLGIVGTYQFQNQEFVSNVKTASQKL